MKKLLTLTSIGIVCGLLVVAQMLALPGSVHAQSFYTNHISEFGANYPGLMCKTRTNNEASVRNLAHGVFNRDTTDLVALNCGFPAHYPISTRAFGDNRVSVYLWVYFARESGVTNATFEEAFCNMYVSSVWDSATSPGSPGSSAVSLGQVRANSYGGTTRVSRESVSTLGTAFPSTTPAGQGNFFSAFCRIPQGVRIQVIGVDPISQGGW